MLRVVKTFNGNNINDGTNYQAVVLNEYANPPSQPVYLAMPNADSEDAGIYTVEANALIVRIKIKNYANRITLLAQLQKWFKRGTQGDLVVTFSDTSTDFSKPCRVVNLTQDQDYPNIFIATLNTNWTTWRAVTITSTVWNLTGTGGTTSISLSGDDSTPLSAQFAMSVAPTGLYKYQRTYQLINAAQSVPALGFGPWCVTLDTSVLVADNSNKCQINNVGGITSGATTIPYDTVTGSLPASGSGYVDTEQIAWTGKTGTTSGNLTGVTRGIGGTTAATHADNAVIKLSYILANCNDLRVFVDDVETNRWITGPNTATTNVWFNLTINTGYTLNLRTSIASSGSIGYIEFAVTPDTINALTAMPNEGILVHGTEWIKYNGKDLNNYRLIVTARNIRGSTAQAHNVGDVFTYMEHVITLTHGNTASVDPATLDATYNNKKPLFRLDTSSNSSWVYDSTSNFFDVNGTGRTGGFQPIFLLGNKNSANYLYTHFGLGGNPVLGLAIQSYYLAYAWRSENARLAWQLYRACGVNTTTATGEKYRAGTTFPALAALQYSSDGANWSNAWTEASPGSAATWTALGSHSGVSMNSSRWIRLLFDGSVIAGASESAEIEIQTKTVAFVSANLPTGTLSNQLTNAHLDITLKNNTNGNTIFASLPMLINLAYVLDGENRTAKYDNVNAHSAMRLDDESRSRWIELVSGNNSITLSATDVGTMAVTLSYYVRRY